MPRLRMRDKIIEAIDKSAIVRITYKDLTYHVEPYCLYASKKGKYYVSCWKRDGGFLKEEGPHWATFILREITSVEMIGTYRYPLWGYRPNSKMYHKVIYKWKYRP